MSRICQHSCHVLGRMMPLFAVWLSFARALVLMECTQKNSAQKGGAVCGSWNSIGSLTNDFPDPMGCPILPDFAWFCLILPGFAWKCLKKAWFCLKLPDFAWNCLILPDFAWNCPKGRLNPFRQAKTNHYDMETWKWLELSENAGKEWGPWATLLPRPLGFSIMGKQTLIMNVSIWFLLFEGLSFCVGERERDRERESANQSFWQPERVSSWNHYYMDSSFFLAFELDLTLWHGYGICAALRHWWGNEHAVQAACWCLILPGLAWNGLKMPDSAWCKKVKNQETSITFEWDFTEFFHRIFPRIFGVCFSAVKTVNATEKRPPKNSARKSIAGTEQNPECRCGRVEASQHALLRSKNYPEKLRISSARSSAPLCLPTFCLSDRGALIDASLRRNPLYEGCTNPQACEQKSTDANLNENEMV